MRLAATKVDITPHRPLPLAGYIERQGLSQGVHLPLYLRALILEDRKEQAALLNFELLGLSEAAVRTIRERVKAELGLPASHILVSCTHTHAGPAGFTDRSPSARTAPFVEEVIARAAAGLKEAYSRLAEVSLGYGVKTVAGICSKRTSPEPGSGLDLTVIKFISEGEKPSVILANFPCHPTILGPDNLLISGDLFGVAASMVERVRGDGTICSLTNGASADVSTRYCRRARSLEECEQLGRALAAEILESLPQVRVHPPRVLKLVQRRLALPLRPLPGRAEVLKRLAAYKEEVRRLGARPVPPGELRRAAAKVEGARALLARLDTLAGEQRTECEAELAGLRLDDLILVTIPGELPAGVGARIRARANSGVHVVILGLTGGYLGYFPDPDCEGDDYEAFVTEFEPRATELLSAAASAIIRELQAL